MKGTPIMTDTERFDRIDIGIRTLMELSHRDAKAKGWRDRPRSFTEEIAMFHSEISEALEAYRLDGEMRTYVGFEGKTEGVPVELADAIIRIAETCEHHGIDLAGAIGSQDAVQPDTAL